MNRATLTGGTYTRDKTTGAETLVDGPAKRAEDERRRKAAEEAAKAKADAAKPPAVAEKKD